MSPPGRCCSGGPIAEVEYLPEEVATWGTMLEQLRELVPRYGCAEFARSYRDMHFDAARVPQLQEVHERLQAATGWSLRPVAGLMHPRDFLNGLAFNTFHSTQYMRHHSNPVYTPEPDLVHELLGAGSALPAPEKRSLQRARQPDRHAERRPRCAGHVPMLLNRDFCELVNAIGRASLGASEKTIWHLTKVYWYTVEFGVVRERGAVKAFGAGILSRCASS